MAELRLRCAAPANTRIAPDAEIAVDYEVTIDLPHVGERACRVLAAEVVDDGRGIDVRVELAEEDMRRVEAATGASRASLVADVGRTLLRVDPGDLLEGDEPGFQDWRRP